MRGPRGSTGRQAVTIASASVLAQGLTAGLFIVGARSTTPAHFGVIVTGIGLGTSLAALLDFGTNSLWVRDIASGRVDQTEIWRRQHGKVFLAILVAIAAVCADFGLGRSTLAVAGGISLGQVYFQAALVSIRAHSMAGRLAIMQVAERAFAAMVMVALVGGGLNGGSALVWGLILGSVAAGMGAHLATPSELRPVIGLRPTARVWKGSTGFGLAGTATSLQSLDVALLSWVAGSGASGIYGAVSRWTQPMSIPINAFTLSALPVMARARTAREAIRSARSGFWLLGLGLVIAVIVALFGTWLAPLLLGRAYTDSGGVLRVLAIAMVPVILNQPLVVLLQARGFQNFVAGTLVGSVVAQAAIMLPLANGFGAIGAAEALAIMQTLLLIALLAKTAQVISYDRGPNAAASARLGVVD